MEIRKRPVNQIRIQILAAQIRYRLAARFLDYIMRVIPDFGSDPEFLAAQTVFEEPLQNLPDRLFIAVNRGTI